MFEKWVLFVEGFLMSILQLNVQNTGVNMVLGHSGLDSHLVMHTINVYNQWGLHKSD